MTLLVIPLPLRPLRVLMSTPMPIAVGCAALVWPVGVITVWVRPMAGVAHAAGVDGATVWSTVHRCIGSVQVVVRASQSRVSKLSVLSPVLATPFYKLEIYPNVFPTVLMTSLNMFSIPLPNLAKKLTTWPTVLRVGLGSVPNTRRLVRPTLLKPNANTSSSSPKQLFRKLVIGRNVRFTVP